MTYCAA